MGTPGLFGGGLLFIVRDGSDLLKHGAKDLGRFVGEGKSLPCQAVIFADSLDGRTRFAKQLKEAGSVVECKKLYATVAFWQKGGGRESELEQWTLKRAKARGLDMTPRAAGFLTDLTGNDLFTLDSELEKLCLSFPDGKGRVDLEEIENITGMSAVHTPFDLQDKIEEKDIPGALRTLSVILRNGMRSASGRLETDAHAISAILLGMFRERVRLSAQVALCLWENRGDDYIRDRLKVRSAFYLNKLKDSARRLTGDALKSMNEALHDAERRIKRRGHLAIPVLEETVIRLARAGT
jgi:DNA polymerase III delta subunit